MGPPTNPAEPQNSATHPGVPAVPSAPATAGPLAQLSARGTEPGSPERTPRSARRVNFVAAGGAGAAEISARRGVTRPSPLSGIPTVVAGTVLPGAAHEPEESESPDHVDCAVRPTTRESAESAPTPFDAKKSGSPAGGSDGSCVEDDGDEDDTEDGSEPEALWSRAGLEMMLFDWLPRLMYRPVHWAADLGARPEDRADDLLEKGVALLAGVSVMVGLGFGLLAFSSVFAVAAAAVVFLLSTLAAVSWYVVQRRHLGLRLVGLAGGLVYSGLCFIGTGCAPVRHTQGRLLVIIAPSVLLYVPMGGRVAVASLAGAVHCVLFLVYTGIEAAYGADWHCYGGATPVVTAENDIVLTSLFHLFLPLLSVLLFSMLVTYRRTVTGKMFDRCEMICADAATMAEAGDFAALKERVDSHVAAVAGELSLTEQLLVWMTAYVCDSTPAEHVLALVAASQASTGTAASATTPGVTVLATAGLAPDSGHSARTASLQASRSTPKLPRTPMSVDDQHQTLTSTAGSIGAPLVAASLAPMGGGGSGLPRSRRSSGVSASVFEAPSAPSTPRFSVVNASSDGRGRFNRPSANLGAGGRKSVFARPSGEGPAMVGGAGRSSIFSTPSAVRGRGRVSGAAGLSSTSRLSVHAAARRRNASRQSVISMQGILGGPSGGSPGTSPPVVPHPPALNNGTCSERSGSQHPSGFGAGAAVAAAAAASSSFDRGKAFVAMFTLVNLDAYCEAPGSRSELARMILSAFLGWITEAASVYGGSIVFASMGDVYVAFRDAPSAVAAGVLVFERCEDEDRFSDNLSLATRPWHVLVAVSHGPIVAGNLGLPAATVAATVGVTPSPAIAAALPTSMGWCQMQPIIQLLKAYVAGTGRLRTPAVAVTHSLCHLLVDDFELGDAPPLASLRLALRPLARRSDGRPEPVSGARQRLQDTNDQSFDGFDFNELLGHGHSGSDRFAQSPAAGGGENDSFTVMRGMFSSNPVAGTLPALEGFPPFCPSRTPSMAYGLPGSAAPGGQGHSRAKSLAAALFLPPEGRGGDRSPWGSVSQGRTSRGMSLAAPGSTGVPRSPSALAAPTPAGVSANLSDDMPRPDESTQSESIAGSLNPVGKAPVSRVPGLRDLPLEVQEMWTRYDVDKSGTLELDEIKDLLEDMGLFLTPGELEDFFHMIDTNGDGTISVQEFVEGFFNNAAITASRDIAAVRRQAANFAKAYGDDLSRKLKERWDQFDREGSGSLSARAVQQLLESLGMKYSLEAVTFLIERLNAMAGAVGPEGVVDADGQELLAFDEFCSVFTEETAPQNTKEQQAKLRLGAVARVAESAPMTDEGFKTDQQRAEENSVALGAFVESFFAPVLCVYILYAYASTLYYAAMGTLAKVTTVHVATDLSVDLIFVTWFALKVFVTPREIHGLVVFRRTEVLREYVPTVEFFVDVLVAFPTSLVYLAAGSPVGSYGFYRVGKVLSVYHFATNFDHFTRKLNPTAVRITSSLVVFLLVAHAVACAAMATTRVYGGKNLVDMFKLNVMEVSADVRYLTSLLWAIGTMAGQIRSDRLEQDASVVLMLAAVIVGIPLFTFFLATITIAVNVQTMSAKYLSIIDSLRGYFSYAKTNPSARAQDLSVVEDECIAYYRHLFTTTGALDIKANPLRDVPLELSVLVTIQTGLDMLRKVPIFQQACENLQFVHEMSSKMTPRIVEPHRIVMKKGERGADMYFVTFGSFHVVNDAGDSVFCMRKGNFFGEIALLLKNGKRTATIVCGESYANVLRLEQRDFNEVMDGFPNCLASVREAAKGRLEQIKQQQAAEKAEKRWLKYSMVPTPAKARGRNSVQPPAEPGNVGANAPDPVSRAQSAASEADLRGSMTGEPNSIGAGSSSATGRGGAPGSPSAGSVTAPNSARQLLLQSGAAPTIGNAAIAAMEAQRPPDPSAAARSDIFAAGLRGAMARLKTTRGAGQGTPTALPAADVPAVAVSAVEHSEPAGRGPQSPTEPRRPAVPVFAAMLSAGDALDRRATNASAVSAFSLQEGHQAGTRAPSLASIAPTSTLPTPARVRAVSVLAPAGGAERGEPERVDGPTSEIRLTLSTQLEAHPPATSGPTEEAAGMSGARRGTSHERPAEQEHATPAKSPLTDRLSPPGSPSTAAPLPPRDAERAARRRRSSTRRRSSLRRRPDATAAGRVTPSNCRNPAVPLEGPAGRSPTGSYTYSYSYSFSGSDVVEGSS